MTLWDDKLLFDRTLDLLGQKEKGYVKFNRARKSIITYTRPDLAIDVTPSGDGGFFGSDIYDGIGSYCARVMARGFQGGLVSADADWIAHAMSRSELDDIDELDIWLQWVKRHVSGVYKASNYYQVLPNVTLDGITIGSPVMFIEETDVRKGTITFLPQHFSTVFLFYGRDNKTEGVIIKSKNWTVKQIIDRFAPTKAEQDKKLSITLKNEIRDGHLYTEHTIIRAVFKKDNPLWDVKGFTKPNAPWISVYFEDKTEEEKKNTPLETEKYFSQPYVVWDYDKKLEESVSRTPAFAAIYDIFGQQEVEKEKRENLKLKNRPPRAVLDDHRNIVDFRPEGITPIAKDDWPNLPKMIDVVGDIKLSRDELELGAEKVRRWFHTQEWLKFTDLTSTLKQQPTATQIIKIAAELATQVNPGIATYTMGFLADVDARIIDIESRAGRGPFNPETMFEISDIILGILGPNTPSVFLMPVFTGPLARAQKVKQELDPLLDGLGALVPLFAEYPDLKHAIREYGTAEDILKAVGFPLKNLRPEDEYDKIVTELNEARARAEAQAFALEAAKVTKDISGPVDPDSILAGVTG